MFAYARSNKDTIIVVVGNLDFKIGQKVTVKLHGVNQKTKYIDLRLNRHISPNFQQGKFTTELNAGDIQVLKIKG